MTNANEEFFELAGKAQGATPEQLRSVAEVARNATAIMKQITILEKQVKELNGAYQKIVTTTLPQILISAGLSEFKNEDKTVHVELKTVVSGTLPKDEEKRKVALQKIIEAVSPDLALLNNAPPIAAFALATDWSSSLR